MDEVYSISKNKELEESKWLKYKPFIIYKNDKEENNLLIKETLVSNNGNEYLMFSVDCNNFEPNSDCYSSLRNSFVPISSKEEYKKFHDEEYNDLARIDKELFETKQNNLKKAKEKILSRTKVD